MGCSGSKTIPQPQAPVERKNSRAATATPERVSMESDVQLIAGDYKKVDAAAGYDVNPVVDFSAQAGVGTWGTGDRFTSKDNGVPGAKYNLPEVTGTDTCNAVFGKMTGERFEEFHNDVPGAKYDLPEVTGTDTCPAAFGKMTGERFDEFFNDVPGAKYDLPEVTGTDTCPAAFGKMTGERFDEFFNDVPGAKYDLPEVTGTDTCPAVFGKMTADRMATIAEDTTQDVFGSYDVQPAFNKAAIKKSNTCGFGKVTGKRFRAPKKTLGGSYNTEKSWKAQGGATFGKTSAGRFGPNRGF